VPITDADATDATDADVTDADVDGGSWFGPPHHETDGPWFCHQ
jgi:hypothetical protein